ncbi:class I SAM-dependent methyltransferase [Sphingomonas morindae]|uniref:Methyltransferase domain-containing protein n=1 Tax=Sphingomonas morindae TaxID=1541170 RepID=A0ABY4X655_9SPHN|nr:methyltransferase domain-containing protein [Sphingomonas morindae]USI72356.1 methyltransferase domain-containing protein [Sphingomonas morindae]
MTAIFQPAAAELNAEAELKLRCDSQSLSFYSDIASFISRHIKGQQAFDMLDVGARTAAGTALLRAIHHPNSFARLKLNSVTALDLDAEALRLAALEYPDINYIARDVESLKGERSWDIVLSSHTIEHVDDPQHFLADLEAVARRHVVIACPFAEVALTMGHVRRFNLDFFERNDFREIEVYRSQHWHGGMACIAIKDVAG